MSAVLAMDTQTSDKPESRSRAVEENASSSRLLALSTFRAVGEQSRETASLSVWDVGTPADRRIPFRLCVDRETRGPWPERHPGRGDSVRSRLGVPRARDA